MMLLESKLTNLKISECLGEAQLPNCGLRGRMYDNFSGKFPIVRTQLDADIPSVFPPNRMTQ